MFEYMFVMTMFSNDRLEPFGGENPRLNILVLACVPDVLQKAQVEGDIRKYAVHGDITVLSADLLRASAELDETLK